MSRAAPINVGTWDRRRLLVVLASGILAVLLFVTGLSFAIYYALTSGRGGASTTSAAPGATPRFVARGGAPAGQGVRDEIAARPMLQVGPDDGRQGTPAAVAGPTIEIPPALTSGPADVPTGYPQTSAGAVGQLAAIASTVLQGMSIPQANEVYAQWAMPGGVGVANWGLTKNVQSFLTGARQQGQSKDPTTTVTATPAAAQIKGIDGQDWAVVCVLADVRAVITASVRVGYGYCERMQWSDGRWMIAPGAAAALAPSTWPGTDLSFRAGWRTWVAASGRG